MTPLPFSGLICQNYRRRKDQRRTPQQQICAWLLLPLPFPDRFCTCLLLGCLPCLHRQRQMIRRRHRFISSCDLQYSEEQPYADKETNKIEGDVHTRQPESDYDHGYSLLNAGISRSCVNQILTLCPSRIVTVGGR